MCCDHLRKCIYAWTGIEVSGDPLRVEAKAALLAVSSAHNLGLDKIIFEGDTPFIFYSFSAVVRQANCAAHVLASWAPFCNSFKALLISILPINILEAGRTDGPCPELF